MDAGALGGEEGMDDETFETQCAAGKNFLFGFAVTHSNASIRTNKTKETKAILLGFVSFCLVLFERIQPPVDL